MNRKRFTVGALLIFALIFAIVTPGHVQGRDKKDPHPSMAPLDQCLIADRNAEIALARTAAPPSVSGDATVVILGTHGFETAAQGKNGFVCIVERAWTSPFDSLEFWNPKNRSPICYNPQAARTILPIIYMRTRLALAGKSKAEIKDSMKTAVEKKELPALEPGAMCSMMSKQAYLTDKAFTQDGAHNMAHMMFYTPQINPADWGANWITLPLLSIHEARTTRNRSMHS